MKEVKTDNNLTKSDSKKFSEVYYHLFWLDLDLVILTWVFIIYTVGTKKLYALAIAVLLYLLIIFETLLTPTFRYILNI
jgi:hypothetical protein